METGRVINRRYLLQRLLKQGQCATVYVGMDQVLQRIVTVKAVSAAHIPAYRAAIKRTAHFSHPNIVGLYDLVVESDVLYVVQEYVEGDDFAVLLQKPLSPFDVADLGAQICQALMYAGSAARQLVHGDLTPSAVVRERNGLARVNNFALPSDLAYFEHWSNMGGAGMAVSDSELAWGVASEGRRADDTRAAGLLLYQLLASRVPGTNKVEPRPDGRLSFQRNTPPELCETVARAVARQHPKALTTEALYGELKMLADAWEPLVPVAVPESQTYAQEEAMLARQLSPAGGKLAAALPTRETEHPAPHVPSTHRAGQNVKLPVAEVVPPSAPTIADAPVGARFIASSPSRRASSSPRQAQSRRRSSLLAILLIGLLAFALLFVVGYIAGQFLIH